MKHKTRVLKGEKYYHIFTGISGIMIIERAENENRYDDMFFKDSNYFHTKESAEQMARKLRAVLNGAEVIEMPSEKEIKESQDRIEDEVVFNIRDVNGSQLIYCTAINKGAELMAEWFKDKIVK